MIAAVAFCPHPPALVPELAMDAASDLGALREACRHAIRTVAGSQRKIVLLGPGPRSVAHPTSARGSLARYGVPVEVPLSRSVGRSADLPLSLTIGAWLVRDALGDTALLGFTVGPDWTDSAASAEWIALASSEAPVTAIVMGDGSGWRDAVAAGRLGERAAAFDAGTAAALASGDPARLAVDPVEAEDLMVSGVAAWSVAAQSLAGRQWSARLEFDSAPFGVGYFVATWT